jgi:hypothetical protein
LRSGAVRSEVGHPAQRRRRGDQRGETGATHRSHGVKEGDELKKVEVVED